MSENNRSSALAAVFDRLDHLTELELRQVYLAIGVRLGDDPVAKPVPRGGNTSRGTKTGVRAKKPDASAAGGKGNPQRKSQWANHPLYQEYSRLKKAVESQAKEGKTSFNAVDTTESRAYRTALSQWLEAKSSFRDHKKVTEETSDEESDEEEETSSKKQPGVSPGRAEPVSTGSATSPQVKPGSSAGQKLPERPSGKLPEVRKTPSPPNSGGKAGPAK